MKSLIVYYSYSGNTKKAAQALQEVLSKRGEAEIFKLEPEDEPEGFFMQAARALIKKKAPLKQAPFDVSGYDLICIGTPVWAFAPSPAVNSYLDGLKNIRGRDAVCFVTYGSGLGAEKCMETMKTALKEKGAFKIYEFKIQQFKVNDENFVKETIKKVL